MELKAQLGRDVRVRALLARQRDVQADALGAGVEGAPIRRLHHAGPAARHDDVVTLAVDLTRARDQTRELARFLVVARLGEDALGNGQTALALRCGALVTYFRLERFDPAPCQLLLDDACAAEDDDRRANVLLAQRQLRLEKLELETDRTHVVMHHEIGVFVGTNVRRRSENTLDPLTRLGIEFLQRRQVGLDLVGRLRSPVALTHVVSFPR